MQLHRIVVQRPDVNLTCCSDQDGQGGGVFMRIQQTLTAFRTQHPNVNPVAGMQAAVVVSVHEPDCFPVQTRWRRPGCGCTGCRAP